jgi:myo-inositol-1-phosphate synthase
VSERPEVKPAEGRLGILLPGFGAVATTVVAGVEAARRGIAKPIGSLTQMNTIRLGKRTEGRAPLIKDFVPLTDLDDIVFGAWDPIPDDGYESAREAGVLERHHIDAMEDFLRSVKPMPAVFDKEYVRRLDGPNVKSGANKYELAQMLREDIRNFKAENDCARLVMVWCGSTEIFLRPGPRTRRSRRSRPR